MPSIAISPLRALGLCGTDLHIQAWDAWAAATIKTPLIPGHEFYGVVVEVGADVRTVKVGDKVSGEGHVVCGMCRNCRAGRRHMCINTVSVGVQRDGHAELSALAPRLADLGLDDRDLGVVEHALGERGVATKRYRKPTFTRPAPTALRQQIAAENQLVIEGLAD